MCFNTLFDIITLLVVMAGTIAGASPTPIHNHQHLHPVKRVVEVTGTKFVEVPGPTVVAFVLDGKIVGQNEVCKGISDGNLLFKDPSEAVECLSSSTEAILKPTAITLATEVAVSVPSVTVQGKQDIKAVSAQYSQAPKPATKLALNTPARLSTPTLADTMPVVTSHIAGPSSEDTPSEETFSDNLPPEETSSAEKSSEGMFSSQPSSKSEGQGLELEFPDGTIDCSTFPSQYGPIEVEWANLGGWSGIQYVTVEGDSVTHIVTAVPGGKGCIPGAMCSYACPPGYQKSQWPSTQGSTGQSVGGIHCNAAGKLSLTNPGLSKNLCMKGTGATTVQNKLSSNAAICRTDYPGLSIT